MCLSLVFTGCAYHFGQGDLAERYSTISIPYVEGDTGGRLTAHLIRRLSTSGAFKYMPHDGSLILRANLVELRDENIGFRYDRKKEGKLKHAVIPAETRLSAIVEIRLIDSTTGKVVRGPARLTASVDFDHDYYYSSRHEVNIFSLGQVNDIDAAHDAALEPLNRCLADKIADYIMNSW
jgi:hypothetical protein